MTLLAIPLSTRKIGALTEQSWNIWLNAPLPCPWWWSGVSDQKTVDVKWNPAKTTVTSAKIHWVAETDSSWFTVNYAIFLNNEKVLDYHGLGGLYPSKREGDVDLTMRLVNGTNLFKVDTVKLVWVPAGYTVTTTVILYMTYEGETPGVSPPTTPFPWGELLTAAAYGALIGGGGLFAYSMFTRPEKHMIDHTRYGIGGALAGAAISAGVRYLISPK
jgi:hypothetical protein